MNKFIPSRKKHEAWVEFINDTIQILSQELNFILNTVAQLAKSPVWGNRVWFVVPSQLYLKPVTTHPQLSESYTILRYLHFGEVYPSSWNWDLNNLLRAWENDWMWGQKLKSRQAKAELSIAPQSNTTPLQPWSRPLCRSLPGSWISLTTYPLSVCVVGGCDYAISTYEDQA